MHRQSLGQVFTPPSMVQAMIGLRQNKGRTLEPSAGEGAFSRALPGCLAIEIDATKAPPGAIVMDFFDLPCSERFDTIIGNPPYVRFQDILPSTREKLDMDLFDRRSNLFLFFIARSVELLNPGGELIFIVPREWAMLTSAGRLNHWLATQGSFTHFSETGDARIFQDASPNCVVFRFEKGRTSRQLADGREFSVEEGQLRFSRGTADSNTLPLSAFFDVKVGAVSGADDCFVHPDGDTLFVTSATCKTGLTRPMIYNQPHPALALHKERLLGRKIRTFSESNWWAWGRKHPPSDGPRIYVNAKTRASRPFFMHPATAFDGSILALFPRSEGLDLAAATHILNTQVDWALQGFKCDGRFLFGQLALSRAQVPADTLASAIRVCA